MSATILTVDDEAGIRAFLADTLAAEGYQVEQAETGEAALQLLEERPFELMLLDLRMPGSLDGMAVLRRARALWPEMQVIVLTAFGTVGNAVEAMRLGAFDFLEKPVDSPDAVRRMARRALNWRGRRIAHPVESVVAADPAPSAPPTAVSSTGISRLRRLFHELRRRHVYHAAATYAAICFAALQMGDLVLPVLPVPGWVFAALVGLAIAGLPVVVALGWIYDVSVTRTTSERVHGHRPHAWQR